jgi:hypothetical protein
VRTEFVTFWLPDPNTVPPPSLTLDGERTIVFDPRRKKKNDPNPAQKPAQKPAQEATKTAKETGQEPATPTPQALKPALQLVEQPTTPQAGASDSERSAKRRRTSPLSSPPKPPVQSPLEEEALEINQAFLDSIGAPPLTGHTLLSIYEELRDGDSAKKIDQMVPTFTSCRARSTLKSPDDPPTVFSFTTLREEDTCNLIDTACALENAHNKMPLRMNWVQQVWFDRFLVVAVFKTRIDRFRRS